MRYRLTFPILKVHGSQSFIVEAESAADAMNKHESGESEFEWEEVDIQELGDPSITEAKP